MRKTLLSMVVVLMTIVSYGQVLPKPSPLGTTTQIVGVTEVSVEYSRPGVKDRTIFGGLLPYGELWRFGANASTKFTTADELSFGDKKLPAGTYAVLAVPNENGNWEIIFNSDTEGGTEDYTTEKDVLRVTTKAQLSDFTETFTLGFDNITNTSANFVVRWENLKLAVPFEVNTNDLAVRNIDAAIKKGEDLDQVYGNSADFYMNTMGDNDKALEYVEKSIQSKETFRNLFTKARILAKQGNKVEAIKIASKALTLAEAAGSKGYANFISGTLASWKK